MVKKAVFSVIAFSFLIFLGMTITQEVEQPKIDVPESFPEFEKVVISAHEGDETAQFLLGFLYWYGSEELNLGMSRERGEYWIGKAAEQGYEVAQDFLSGRYAFGDDLKVNGDLVYGEEELITEQSDKPGN